MVAIRLGSIALDCAEPLPLARFWAQLLGGEIAFTSDEFVAVKLDHGWIATVQTPGYEPPTWPNGSRPKQMHLDLAVADLDEAEAAAVGMGARVADVQPQPSRWRVLFDPAGHPFCLSTQIPE